jgi:hypothetical protein
MFIALADGRAGTIGDLVLVPDLAYNFIHWVGTF